MTTRCFQTGARGSVLIEALVGILIFSIGILALVAMQAESVRNTSEAKYRNDASYLANQIIGRMWGDRANLANYSHRPGGTPCAATGTASTYSGVTDWLADVTSTLPNSTATRQQIIIGANNLVTVGLCWQTGGGSPHNLVVSAQIQG